MTPEPTPSEHLGRAHLAEIRVSPGAEAGYRGLTRDTDFPPGSWFVEWLRDARSGQTGPVFALERSAEGWRYWVLDAQGREQQRGLIEPCAGCHAGAPAPPIFGLPAPTQESSAGVPRSP